MSKNKQMEERESKYKNYKLESWEIEPVTHFDYFNKPCEFKGYYDLNSNSIIDEKNFKQFLDKVLILKGVPSEKKSYDPSTKKYLTSDQTIDYKDAKNKLYRCVFAENKRCRIDDDFVASDLQYLDYNCGAACRNLVWKDDKPNFYLKITSHEKGKSLGYFSHGETCQYEIDYEKIGFESVKSAVDFCNKIFKGKHKVNDILRIVESRIDIKDFNALTNHETYELTFTGNKKVKTGKWHREYDDVDGDTYDVDQKVFVGVSARIFKVN